MNKKITILLFHKNNISIIKKKQKTNLYIYNTNFYFLLILTEDVAYFMEQYTKYFIIYFNKNNLWSKILNTYLSKLFYSWNNFFFKKIKFSGKGYKIKKSKKKKSIKLYFNKSHFTIYSFRKEFLKKIRKTKFLLKSTNYKKLTKNIIIILNIRNLNLYTKKGLRLARNVTFKKASKKGVSL
jgi:ribosomal protein L6P/L9E